MGRVAFGVGLCLVLSVPSCTNDDGNKDDEEEGGDPPPPAGVDWTLESVDLSSCGTEIPEARYASATAFFTAPEPVYFDERPINRGFLMIGGRTSASDESDRLQDLWLYDTAAVEACPWILVSSSGFGLIRGGISDARLVFDESEARFVHVGGFKGDFGVSQSSGQIWTLALDELSDPGAHFEFLGLTEEPVATVHEESAEPCFLATISNTCQTSACANTDHPVDPCTGIDPNGDGSIDSSCNDMSLLDHGDHPFHLCAGDPTCTNSGVMRPSQAGGEYAEVIFFQEGVGSAAAVYTGAGVRTFGGTMGCYAGVDCVDMDSLHSLNVAQTTDFDWAAIDYDATDAYWPVNERFGLTSSEWVDGATLAVRGWSAAPLGRSWDHVNHGFRSAVGLI